MEVLSSNLIALLLSTLIGAVNFCVVIRDISEIHE